MKRLNVATMLVLALLTGCGGDAQPDRKTGPVSAMARQASVVSTDTSGTYTIAGYRSNYKIANINGSVTVTSKIDPSDVRILQNPKLIKFADLWTSFDIDGPAGQVYRMYQAAFNRKPDLPGLGFWIHANQNDPNATLIGIAGGFIGSDEFRRMYGESPPDASFVDSLYRNVLHRAGEAEGFNWWLNALKGGTDRRGVLFGFSDSEENKRNLRADMANGFDYEPFNPGYLMAKRTSYENSKNFNIAQIIKPGKSWYPVQAIADFTRTGKLDMVVAYQNYSPDSVSLVQVQAATLAGDTRYLSDLKYFTQNSDGSWIEQGSFATKGCLHPRKAGVADFNGDGYPDIAIACTGYDSQPHPGEYSLLLTNDRKGGFKVSNVSPTTGFYHSIAAFDTEGNGFADLVVVDNTRRPNVYVLRNQKDGTFKEDFSAVSGLSDQIFRYYSVEVVDANRDGMLDLVVGGNENLNPTEILHGDVSGKFGDPNSRLILPSVGQRATVLDFVLLGDTLFVGRTSDDKSLVGYYNTQTLQKVDLKTLQSTIVLDKVTAGQLNWIHWWMPTTWNGVVGVVPYASVDNGGSNVSSYFFAK